MKHTYTKLAIAMLIATSGASYAAGTNFSNLSVGTVTNLTISQTGDGRGRISGGNALTATQGSAGANSAAKVFTVSEASDSDVTTFTHVGSLATLSLTQANSTANASDPTVNNENTIRGALYTTGGSVTVSQDGKQNAVDLAIGTSDAPLTSPSITITQKNAAGAAGANMTSLTRTAGTNTDTIASYGGGNLVRVSGSATGANTVNLTIGTDGARTSDDNTVWVTQSGTGAHALTATVTGDSNRLDLTQSGITGTSTSTVTGNSNYIYLAQSGTSNTATTTTNNNSNSLDVTQTGTSSTVTATLNNAGGNNVDISQAGSSQNATLALSGAGSGSTISITQGSAATSAVANLTLVTNSTGNSITVAQNTSGASYTYNGTLPQNGSINITQ